MNPLILLFAIQACWTPPTENVDGSPLTDLDGYRIYYGAESRAYTEMIDITDETLTCYEWTAAPGEHYVAMTALDSEGNESQYSNEVLKTELATDPAPMPPVMLAGTETVFTVVKQPGRFVLLPIGTVPAGTVCDPNNSVNGHGAVPTDDVAWSPGSTARPVVVVAQCNG